MNEDFKFFTKLNQKLFLLVFFGFLVFSMAAVLLFGIGPDNSVMFLTAISVALIVLVVLVKFSIQTLGRDRLISLDTTIYTILMRLQKRVNALISRS